MGWVAAEDSSFIVFSRHLLLGLRLLTERLLKALERLLNSGSRPGKCTNYERRSNEIYVSAQVRSLRRKSLVLLCESSLNSLQFDAYVN